MRLSRRLSLTLVLALAATVTVAPVSAQAEAPAPETVEAELALDTELVERPDGTRLTEPVEAPIAFSSLWLTVSSEVEAVNIRTSVDGETWNPWTELGMLDAEDGPDAGSDEEAATEVALERVSELFWADESHWFQLEVPAEVDEVDVKLIDSEGLNESVVARTIRVFSPRPAPAVASNHPSWIQPRSAWGASAPRSNTRAASQGVSLVVVHHTATPNGYTRESVPARMRSMQSYHQGLGWADLGYNIVVDRFGGVWEGRAGGVDRAIVGAHASNFNTGSFGVAVIGNYTSVNPSQASVDALARVIGWKAAVHGFDPGGTVEFNGSRRPVVLGHKDVGQTSCPGLITNYFPQIRNAARYHASPFNDVSIVGTHSTPILRLHAAGVINGCGGGNFCPRDELTRAQAASLIARALDLPDGNGARFSDVARNSTHEKAIGAVYEAGIVGGYTDGRFGVNDPLTRDQMASFIARAMKLQGVNGSGFSDVRASSTHGRNIYAIRDANITGGCTNTRYCPRDNVTREQMASFVDRMRNQMR